jgi:hypothetical protein
MSFSNRIPRAKGAGEAGRWSQQTLMRVPAAQGATCRRGMSQFSPIQSTHASADVYLAPLQHPHSALDVVAVSVLLRRHRGTGQDAFAIPRVSGAADSETA